MPGWSGLLGEGQIQSLAILIAEQRVDRRFTDFKTDMALTLPVDPVETRLATFRVETVVEGIAPKPFFGSGITNGSTRK